MLQTIYHMILTILNLVSTKSWLTKLGITMVAYFTPISEMIHVMLIFLALDTISGIWASLKSGSKLESRKLRKTVYKFLWYTIAVVSAWMMQRTFLPEWANLASVVAGFICFVELKSIFENITNITGEPVFLRIFKLFKNRASSAIDEVMDTEAGKEKS